MKTEILQILQMQAEGKLTQDQAAELLAVLADQAREKSQQSDSPPIAGQGGAPDPRGGTKHSAKSFYASSAAAIHGLVDTAIGVGTTVGRAASVFGGEVVDMVHRDEGGNSVTLSKVDAPVAEASAFNGNTLNVSKVGHLTLHQAQVCGNTVNASKMTHLSIARGRFSQCNVSGSSITHVTIAGPEAPGAAEGESTALATRAAELMAGVRGVTFNASKFSRVHLTGESALEVSTIQASAVKDWEFAGSTLRDSKINDASVSGLSLKQTEVRALDIQRSHVQQLKLRDVHMNDVHIAGIKLHDVTVSGGTWSNVKIRREGAGLGGRESLVQEATFDHCELTACDFAGCTFRRTTFRNLKLADITVRNVDFTGLTLETEADFRRAAGI